MANRVGKAKTVNKVPRSPGTPTRITLPPRQQWQQGISQAMKRLRNAFKRRTA